MLSARRDPVLDHGAHDALLAHSRAAGHAGAPAALRPTGFARFIAGVQILGTVLGIPLGLASGYSIYRANFSPEATCGTLRANIVSMLDKNADASTLRLLVRRDVATFERSCGAVDPDAVAAFKTLLRQPAAVAAATKEHDGRAESTSLRPRCAERAAPATPSRQSTMPPRPMPAEATPARAQCRCRLAGRRASCLGGPRAGDARASGGSAGLVDAAAAVQPMGAPLPVAAASRAGIAAGDRGRRTRRAATTIIRCRRRRSPMSDRRPRASAFLVACHSPFVPAKAGTQGQKFRDSILALGSRVRGNGRSLGLCEEEFSSGRVTAGRPSAPSATRCRDRPRPASARVCPAPWRLRPGA